MKAFFIRVLQVIWVISVVVIVINLPIAIAYPKDAESILGASFGWLVFLMILQYLAFASLNPSWAFGKSKGRYFTLFLIASFFLAIVGGIGLKLYNKYEHRKKLEAGTDIVFFDGILRDTMIRYDLTECRNPNRVSDASKDDLRAAVSRLEGQNIRRLNILVNLANQNDAVGRRVRCLIDENSDIEQVVDIINIANGKPII